MKKLSVLTIASIMLLGVFVVPSAVHAQGAVSVNGGSNIQIPKTQTTVDVPIDISASAGFNAFQIIISADPSILQGASISLTGSVLPNPAILAECIGGVLVAGVSCANQAIDQRFVELAAVNQAGGSTTNPVSGLLFTITYNVVGLTGGTTIGFQNGCPTSSVAMSTDCVQVNSGGQTLPETDMGATFINNVGFSQTPVFAKLSTPSGVAIKDQINYAAIGPFVDLITETASCSGGLTTCSLQVGSVDLTASTTGNDNLTVSGTSDGVATIHACGLFNPGICQDLSIPVKVSAPGFSIALSQSTVTVSRGNSDSSTIITVTGFSGFSAPVSFSASTAGITGSASSATPVPNGSGYGTATSALTITVASTVATGTYPLVVTGSSTGFSSSMQTINVVVPPQNFLFSAVPAEISILRGASLSTTLNLVSLGNFAGTATFTATIAPVAGQQDSCCLTNNITPSFTPNSIALPAGGAVIDTLIATTIGGSADPTTFTATGNYTAVVTATINGVTQSVLITFNVEDFTVGPAFCEGGNFVQTTPNSNNAFFADLATAGNIVGTPCNSLTITDQPNVLFPYNTFGVTVGQTLWVQTNALGGLVTNGFNGTPAIAALNSQIPANGVGIPQLAVDFPPNGTKHFFWPSAACILPTFLNGVQLSYSYLATHGPLIIPGTGLFAFLSIIAPRSFPPGALGNWGCKFDSGAWPNDQGVAALNQFDCTHGGCTFFPTFNNPDFFGVTAMSLVGTVAGVYTFQLCGQGGILIHCNMYTLNVVASPTIHQLVFPRTVSFAGSGGAETFKLGVHNPGIGTIDFQVTVTATGDFGDTLTAISAIIPLGPGLDSNNIALSLPLTSLMVGETFSFSFSIAVGSDSANQDGISTLVTAGRASGTFHVTT